MRSTAFVRRACRRNEQHAIQLEAISSLTRNGEVSLVNGVERTAENRELHTRSIFTELTLTSLIGRSAAPRGIFEIFSTTS